MASFDDDEVEVTVTRDMARLSGMDMSKSMATLAMEDAASSEEESEEGSEGEDAFDASEELDSVVAKLSTRFPFMRVSVAGGDSRRTAAAQCAWAPPPASARLSVGSGRLPSSYNGRNSLFLFSSSQPLPPLYDLDASTRDNYAEDGAGFHGSFGEQRAGLDLDYHGNYVEERQAFQDKIVAKMLDGPTVYDSVTGRPCDKPQNPWVVFTAGVMGSGKSHTMKNLASRGLFPLKSYIIVDPDEIRSHFPEYHLYAAKVPRRAGELTHREAGYISEIVTTAAMDRGYNVLVDGSLKDHEWYREYFKSLREKYPGIRIAILHIVAPREAILARAKKRAKETGRVVPAETLEASLRQVPVSVKRLAPDADFFCELDNPPGTGEAQMRTAGIAWDEFRDNWKQRGRA